MLVVDDEELYRRALERILLRVGHQVSTARDAGEALSLVSSQPIDLVLCDVKMPGINGLELVRQVHELEPDLPCIVITGYGSAEHSVEALRAGAFWYLEKPFDQGNLDVVRRLVEQAIEHGRLKAENRLLQSQLRSRYRFENIVGTSTALRRVLETVEKVADSDSTVLITGESGTGKSLLAAQIHRLSPRREQAFVEVACTTLHEHLLESELFGHVRGAFTGAIKDKPGRLEAADGGTVFLDEIGDIPPPLQAKLLRFLQEKAFERVGGTETIHIDARIIAATNQDLEQLVRDKRFREDLYYRLNVIEIRVPPLRERQSEIIALAEHLIARSAEVHHKPALKLSEEARAALLAYSWPGNVRELRNVIERAVVLSRGDAIALSDLPDRVLGGTRRDDQGLTLEELERKHIQSVLEQAVTLEEAADMLGINVATLWRKRRRYGLE